MNPKRLTLLVATAAVALVLVAAGVYWDDILVWYRLTRDFERLADNAQGYREYRHRQTGIVFVRVPGGTFMMGSLEGEEGRREDELQHEVTLTPFLIAKYELTQNQWEKVMGSRPSSFTGDNLPVEKVSWEDCKDFCRRAGLALPTEAQWEYACRAGSETAYHSGDSEEGLKKVAWYGIAFSRGGKTHPVGEKMANGFGLHDMHGNVWEWCEDLWDPAFYGKPEATQKNPVRTASGSGDRVFRGGCWDGNASFCRSGARLYDRPSDGSRFVGFRPVYNLR